MQTSRNVWRTGCSPHLRVSSLPFATTALARLCSSKRQASVAAPSERACSCHAYPQPSEPRMVDKRKSSHRPVDRAVHLTLHGTPDAIPQLVDRAKSTTQQVMLQACRCIRRRFADDLSALELPRPLAAVRSCMQLQRSPQWLQGRAGCQWTNWELPRNHQDGVKRSVRYRP
jgi:hypothetical protein